MSFTGKATYAQLYPSRSPCDAGEKTYEQGSVFLYEENTSDIVEIYMLTQVHDGLILVCVTDGDRWSDDNITPINSDNSFCTKSELLRSFDPWQNRFKFIGMAKDVLGLTARCKAILDKGGA